jgi:hypothetical protein
VTVLSFSVPGYHAGLVSTQRSRVALPVAITFAVVIWLIADLNRPQEGTLPLNQQALVEVRASMRLSNNKRPRRNAVPCGGPRRHN